MVTGGNTKGKKITLSSNCLPRKVLRLKSQPKPTAMGAARTTLKRAAFSESNMADISNSLNKLVYSFKAIT